MADSEAWYIVKQSDGHCEIIPAGRLATMQDESSSADRDLDQIGADQQWGPFSSQGEAIARRVGLIRAGKCQPV